MRMPTNRWLNRRLNGERCPPKRKKPILIDPKLEAIDVSTKLIKMKISFFGGVFFPKISHV